MNIGLTQRDIFRFMKTYFGLPLRDVLSREAKLLAQTEIKAEKIRERTQRKSL